MKTVQSVGCLTESHRLTMPEYAERKHGDGYQLIYPYNLPHVGDSMHWRIRFEQRKRAIRIFGELLPQLRATSYAEVTITRVLGGHQRRYDSDNLRTACKGLRDALKHCGYVVDDSPTWAQFEYLEDETRRSLGPRVEVVICYRGHDE